MTETFQKNSRILLLAVLLVTVVAQHVKDGKFADERLQGDDQHWYQTLTHWHNPSRDGSSVHAAGAAHVVYGGILVVKATAYNDEWAQKVPQAPQAAKLSLQQVQLAQFNITLPNTHCRLFFWAAVADKHIGKHSPPNTATIQVQINSLGPVHKQVTRTPQRFEIDFQPFFKQAERINSILFQYVPGGETASMRASVLISDVVIFPTQNKKTASGSGGAEGGKGSRRGSGSSDGNRKGPHKRQSGCFGGLSCHRQRK